MSIENMYLRMPKKYQNKSYNPHFDVHGLSLPLRGLVAAPSGSGKTNMVMNLSRVFDGTF
jgi:hypothetical protein